MKRILIGKIVSVTGLKGEVKVYNYSDSSDIYRTASVLYAGGERYEAEAVRTRNHMVILKLGGVDDRDQAEAMRGRDICIDEDELPVLPEGQYYVKDIIGMEVFEEDGDRIGVVSDVIQNTAQDIYEIKRPDGSSALIPRVDEFILDTDPERRRITVRLIEGMLE